MNLDNNLIKYAYIRGFIKENNIKIDDNILTKDLYLLTLNEKEALDKIALENKLKTYYFKEKDILPRASIILGFLKGIEPQNLLDVGSGRGVFLFPLLKEFKTLKITSIDILDHRVKFLKNIKDGGIDNLNPLKEDITTYSELDNTYEVVTLLEVLEHIPNVEEAIKNAIRLSSKFIVVTVPSKEDNNPEHIHLLTKDKLTKMFNNNNVSNLKFSGVNGHLVLIARKSDKYE